MYTEKTTFIQFPISTSCVVISVDSDLGKNGSVLVDLSNCSTLLFIGYPLFHTVVDLKEKKNSCRSFLTPDLRFLDRANRCQLRTQEMNY